MRYERTTRIGHTVRTGTDLCMWIGSVRAACESGAQPARKRPLGRLAVSPKALAVGRSARCRRLAKKKGRGWTLDSLARSATERVSVQGTQERPYWKSARKAAIMTEIFERELRNAMEYLARSLA